MIKKILIALAIIVVVFLVIVALQPNEYRVTRSVAVSASAAVLFAQVNDLHQWAAWSPWEKIDPAMQRTFAGPAAGTGAIYSWAGNKEVGEGRMTIVESRPSDFIRMKLEFFKPFASQADTEFTFKPEGNQTTVTWSMSGQKNFVSKAVCLFMSMDKMIGGDFEKGLAGLKTISETAAKK